jgi:hypothetical protein
MVNWNVNTYWNNIHVVNLKSTSHQDQQDQKKVSTLAYIHNTQIETLKLNVNQKKHEP